MSTAVHVSDRKQQLVAGQPVWAKLFYMVRTGNLQEALQEALRFQQAIEHREASFVNHFRTWIESSDRKCVYSLREIFDLTL